MIPREPLQATDVAAATRAGDMVGTRSIRVRLRRLADSTAVPLSAHLELTRACNLKCRHCYLEGSGGSELSDVEWLRLLDEVRAMGCWSVALTGGEVGCRPGWLTVARHVRDLGMSLTVLTNGTAFSDQDLHDLAHVHPTVVSLSLYGSTAGVHEAVTGVSGSFARAIHTMIMLRQLGVRVRASVILMRSNFHDLTATRELAKSLDCEPVLDFILVPRSNGDTDVLRQRIDEAQLEAFFRLRDRLEAEEGSGRPPHDTLAALSRTVGMCSAGRSAFFVSAEGDVLPCMGFEPKFGNVRQQPFSRIWLSPQAAEHRRLMSEPAKKCMSCEVAASCSLACPRRSMVEEGDARIPGEWVCRSASILHTVREADRISRPTRALSCKELA